MNSINLYKKVYKILNVITSLAAILLMLCFAFSFDASSGYLTTGPLTIGFFVMYVIGAVVSASSIFLASEFDHLETPDELHHKSKMHYAISAIASILFGALVFFLINVVNDSQTLILSGIALLSFGIYNTLVIFLGYKFNVIKLCFLFISMLFPISIGVGNNKNYFHHINSIENILTVLFAISFLLYILYEARRVITGRHSELHVPTMLLTYMSGASLSVAYVFSYFFETVNEGYRFYQMIMIFLISLHMMFELNRFIATASPKSKYSKTHIASETDDN